MKITGNITEDVKFEAITVSMFAALIPVIKGFFSTVSDSNNKKIKF